VVQLLANSEVSMKIPKIIHQIWIQGQASLPEIYRTASKTWQKNNRDWNYTLWDGPALREFMATEAPEWLPLYDAQGEMEAKADVARYALLLVRGGLYADMDTECLRPAAGLLGRSQASLFLQVYDCFHPVDYAQIANSVIASVPDHPIWRQVRAQIERNPSPSYVPARTGPILLWSVVKSYAEDNVQDVCFWDHRQVLTKFYLPRACMRWYGFIRRKICVLDFNDSLREALLRELRRPHQLLVAFVKDRLSRRDKLSGPH
jgi:mannosyltransferase OCH1-like enzyme